MVRDGDDVRGVVRMVLLGGDEGVDAIGGGAIGDADGFGVIERSVIDGGATGNRARGDDHAGFAARWLVRARLDVLELRGFVLVHVELVRMRDARVERRWKQGKAEERRRGVMGSREAHCGCEGAETPEQFLL